ncbi:hypothetical protein [Methyloglobulus sp.]|uniref:hypothetical protein n=1 Tax=Methyloglobulus sp. TaxID=2518622 RepID=UPI0032B85EB6
MPMNTAELIYQETQVLPENLRVEVLDFIGYLKTRYAIENYQVDTQQKIAELDSVFAPFRRNFKGFKFNRDEANER